MATIRNSGAVNPPTKDLIYSDLNISFAKHPVTKKLSVLKNDDAVKRALKNLILTNKYERPYDPAFGGDIRNRLFDNFDNMTKYDISKDIQEIVANYEPRVKLLSVDVNATPNLNSLNISIIFRVVNSSEPIKLEFIVERLR